jgi:hypothetical protein
VTGRSLTGRSAGFDRFPPASAGREQTFDIVQAKRPGLSAKLRVGDTPVVVLPDAYQCTTRDVRGYAERTTGRRPDSKNAKQLQQNDEGEWDAEKPKQDAHKNLLSNCWMVTSSRRVQRRGAALSSVGPDGYGCKKQRNPAPSNLWTSLVRQRDAGKLRCEHSSAAPTPRTGWWRRLPKMIGKRVHWFALAARDAAAKPLNSQAL